MKFYVYEHWRPDTDVCFYVGKGKGLRAFDLRRNNRRHRFIVAKLNSLGMCPEVRLVASDLDEQAAFEIERQRISFWRGSGVALANVADGGPGAPGYKHLEQFKLKAKAQIERYNASRGPISESTREKMRLAKLGKKQSAEHIAKVTASSLGRKYPSRSAEYRAKMAAAKTGRKATAETRAKMSAKKLGKKLGPRSEETRAKLSASLRGKPWSAARRAAQIKEIV